MNLKKIILLSSLLTSPAFADTVNAVPEKTWALTYFHGWMTDNNILPVIFMDNIRFKYGYSNGLDLAHTLTRDNPLRQFFQPMVSSVEFDNSVLQRMDPNGTIYEADSYLMLRWQNFAWDDVLINTVGFGDGFSYVTDPLYREDEDSSNDNAKRLLNYLALEVSFALPAYPNMALVARVHHRCGAWGLFGAGNLSSNTIEAGFRYYF